MSHEKTFFTDLSRIDSIITAPPATDTVNEIIHFIKLDQFDRYIFTNLDNISWLKPLQEAGAFDSVPEPKNDGQTSYWYQMDYLQRVCSENPRLVFEIVKPHLETKNGLIRAGILSLSKHFSNEDIILVSKKLIFWVDSAESGRLHFLKDSAISHVDELIHRNLKPNVTDALKSLLAVRSKERTFGKGSSSFTSRDVVSILDSWDYRNLLKKDFKKFFSIFPEDAYDLLADALNQAVSYKNQGQPPEDYSTIWCKGMSDPSLESPNDVEETLVAACRDYAVEYIKTKPAGIEFIVNSLSKRKWAIFERLRLFIISENPGSLPDLTRKELGKVDYLNSYDYKKEYLELLGAARNLIDHNLKLKILSTIEKGRKDLYDNPKSPTEEELKYAPLREAFWKSERLLPILDILPKEWQDKLKIFTEIVADYEKENPPYPSGVWSGPNSSKTLDELNKLNDSDLLEVLRKEPVKAKAPWLSSPEGLARTLSGIIRKNPNRKPLFENILTLNPIYIQGFLTGLQDGLDNVSEETWVLLIELLLQIKEKISTADSLDHARENEDFGSWDSVKRTATWLLKRAIQAKTISMGTALSEKTWILIEWLASDPNPSLQFEEKYVKSPAGAYQAAINSVRGEAIHCLIQFGLNKFNLEKKSNPNARMPDNVRKLLTFHIDPKNDPSLAIRSVYGVYLPWLILMDKEWVAENFTNLFPLEPENKDKYLAVWVSYLTHCEVYDDVYSVLSTQYNRSLDELKKSWGKDPEDDKPKEKIAEHLMVLYWRGKITLSSGLLEKFYERAPLELRKAALNFAGRSAKNTQGEMQAEVKKRFYTLIEHRFFSVKQTDEVSELSPFGWWFNCSHFNREWRLEWLRALLAIGVIVEPDFDIFETLESMKTIDSTSVLACLERLLDQDNGRQLYSEKDIIKKLLSFYLNEPKQKQFQSRALDMVNKMGIKGFLDFRELLAGKG